MLKMEKALAGQDLQLLLVLRVSPQILASSIILRLRLLFWDGYATPISYVAGFHLNNRLYLGGGVGLNYNFEGLTREDDMGPKSGYDHKHEPGFYAEPQPLYIHAWSFPLFANVRYYFNNYKIKPFISLNAGVFIS